MQIAAEDHRDTWHTQQTYYHNNSRHQILTVLQLCHLHSTLQTKQGITLPLVWRRTSTGLYQSILSHRTTAALILYQLIRIFIMAIFIIIIMIIVIIIITVIIILYIYKRGIPEKNCKAWQFNRGSKNWHIFVRLV